MAYRVEVSAPSFGTYVQSAITLQVGNNVEIDVTLQLGSLTQQVQVAADAAMVETQHTSVSQVIDQRRITELPLNGRQPTDLILLSGGAAMPPNSSRDITTHDYSSAVGVSVSAGPINGNSFLLDGADHNDSPLKREPAVSICRRPARVQRADRGRFVPVGPPSRFSGEGCDQVGYKTDSRQPF